jgi:hypothetical protein
MNNKADEYRRNAADCLRMAERTADLAARATLLDMAQSWRVLAEQAQRNSANDIVYETPPRLLPASQPVTQQQQQVQPDPEPDEKKPDDTA